MPTKQTVRSLGMLRLARLALCALALVLAFVVALRFAVVQAASLTAAAHSALDGHRDARSDRHTDAASGDRRGKSDKGDDSNHSDDSADNDEIKFEGFVVVAPENPTGLGEWLIQADLPLSYTVLVNPATEFDLDENERPIIPRLGDWVEVEGEPQADGAILATELEREEYEGGQFVVQLASGCEEGDLTLLAQAHDLVANRTPLTPAQRVYLLTADDEDFPFWSTLAALAAEPCLDLAEPNYVHRVPMGSPYKSWRWGGREPSDYQDQAAFEHIDLAAAHAGGTRGAGITIAVLDTGVAYTHPGLAGHLVAGYDFIDNDSSAAEEQGGVAWGHGTHVAGIIARVAPDSKIMPVRVLDANGSGTTLLLAYGIDWAVQNGADVINLSLGAEFDSEVLMQTIAQAQAAGVVVVAAAGNENRSGAEYPASYAGVIGVTAVFPAGAGGAASFAKADFANYGADLVDLAAPGVGVVSTIVGPNGLGYAAWSGTSMAAPFVSGAAALVRQSDPALSPAEVEGLLEQHALSLDAANPGYRGQLGGLLDVSAAVADPGPQPDQTPTPTPPASTPPPRQTPIFLPSIIR